MTHILILEGNTPDICAAGNRGAAGFEATIGALDASIRCTVLNPYDGALAVNALDGMAGVIFTGSGTAWSTDAPEAAPQRAAMEQVFKSGLPVWGSCNGMQLAACVLGGAVGASPNGLEVGLARDLQLTDAGKTHPMCAGRSTSFAVPCVHRDEVTALPKGATLLITNTHSPIQGFAYEQGGVSFWGVQYHPELTPARIADYLSQRDGIFTEKKYMIDDLLAAETNADAAARLGADLSQTQLQPRSNELANWLTHVKTKAVQ